MIGGAVRRTLHAAARRGLSALPREVREVAAALAARAATGPALLPGPPPGPVLVVAPHPDDESIGCGGAIARHVDRGDDVVVVMATSGGATSGGGAGDVTAAREAEGRAACALLGAGEPVFARLPDGRLGQHTAALAELLAEHGADAATIYVPSLLDPHPDHRAANAAVAAAGLPGDVFGYEVWAAAPVDVLLDVTAVFGRKQRALQAYTVALEAVDYVRTATGLAAYRSAGGAMGGRGYAEGFLRLSAAEHAAACAQAGLG